MIFTPRVVQVTKPNERDKALYKYIELLTRKNNEKDTIIR